MKTLSIDPGGTKRHAYAVIEDERVTGAGFLANDVGEWMNPIAMELLNDTGYAAIVVEDCFVSFGKNVSTSIMMAKSVGRIIGAIRVMASWQPIAVVPPREWIKHYYPTGRLPKQEKYIPELVQKLSTEHWEFVKALSTADRKDVASAVYMGLYYQQSYKEV